MRQLVAQDSGEPRGQAVEPTQGHPDRPVVHARRPFRHPPLGYPGLHHQQDDDRVLGAEAEAPRVLRVRLRQHVEDGDAQRLVDAAVVAYAELGPLRRARRSGGDVLQLSLDRGVGAQQEAPPVLLLGPGAVAHRRIGVAEEGARARVPIVEPHGPQRRIARGAAVAEGEERFRQRLEGRERFGIAAEGDPREPRRLDRVLGRQPLPRLQHVGIGRRRRRRVAVDAHDHGLGHAVDPAVLLVAHLVALEPRAVGFDHVAVGEGDDVGGRARAEEGDHEQRPARLPRARQVRERRRPRA